MGTLFSCLFCYLFNICFLIKLLPNANYRSVPPNHFHIIETLLDVHGYEMFELGVFNGDPHPGNIWMMDTGALGLIDYGQVQFVFFVLFVWCL
jgi:hypothetical protein